MMSETADGTQNGEAVERDKEMKVEAKRRSRLTLAKKDPSYDRGKS